MHKFNSMVEKIVEKDNAIKIFALCNIYIYIITLNYMNNE